MVHENRNCQINTQHLRSSPTSLESILCTDQLESRPSRPPDKEGYKKALEALCKAIVESPDAILQKVAETTLQLLRAQSAGVSLISEDGKSFYWPAIAGLWKPHVGDGTPRDFGPCGDVLDHNCPLLFKQPQRRYSYLEAVTPLIEECLLVPFYDGGEAIGTLWVVAHDDSRKFDSEDLLELITLGKFAELAYIVKTKRVEAHIQRAKTTHSRKDVQKKREELYDRRAQLSEEGKDKPETDLEPMQDEIGTLQMEIQVLQANSHDEQDDINRLRRQSNGYTDEVQGQSEDTQTRAENIQTMQENLQKLREDIQRQREEWAKKQSMRKK